MCELGIVPERKKVLKIVVILSLVWLAIAVPVPFLWVYPGLADSQEFQVYVAMTILISIPLAVRGFLWIRQSRTVVQN